jgi:hypothetical protein
MGLRAERQTGFGKDADGEIGALVDRFVGHRGAKLDGDLFDPGFDRRAVLIGMSKQPLDLSKRDSKPFLPVVHGLFQSQFGIGNGAAPPLLSRVRANPARMTRTLLSLVFVYRDFRVAG